MTLTNNTPPVFDRETAAAVVRFVTGSFAAEVPADGYSEADLSTLARKLSWLIDADVRPNDVDELVVTIMELDELDRGVHHMLEVSRSGSVDNTGWLLENIESRIAEQVQGVLVGAHFYPWVVPAAELIGRAA